MKKSNVKLVEHTVKTTDCPYCGHKRADRVVEFWRCENREHRHTSKAAASRCSDKDLQAGKTERSRVLEAARERRIEVASVALIFGGEKRTRDQLKSQGYKNSQGLKGYREDLRRGIHIFFYNDFPELADGSRSVSDMASMIQMARGLPPVKVEY